MRVRRCCLFRRVPVVPLTSSTTTTKTKTACTDLDLVDNRHLEFKR